MAGKSEGGIVKALPASESGRGVQYTTPNGDVYVISQDPAKRKFTLWKVVAGGYERIKNGASDPYELYALLS